MKETGDGEAYMNGKLLTDVLTVGPIETNCYMLRDSVDRDSIVLVDPGDEAEEILRAAAFLGGRITAILITHGHNDHTLAVEGILKAQPDAKLFFPEADLPMVADQALNCASLKTDYRLQPDVRVKDGDGFTLIGHRFRVLGTPGHTAGSCCYYVEDAGCLYAGDTLFYHGFGRTDLPTGSRRELIKSLGRLLTGLPGDTLVFPGHGPETTIGHEKSVEGL